MAEVGSAFVTIAPSAKGFGSSLNNQVSGETRSAGSSIGRTFGKMFVLGASVIAAAGIGKLLKGSIEEAREANKVGATTAQVIKSTGGAANLTAKQVGNLSTKLSNKIGVDDEAIQTGANLLLTFKNVRNEAGKGADIFTRATAAGADLAATGFGSIESNAKTLGKALNDPVKGITALTRAGVTFTEQQKEQIKGYVESGDLLGAQKIILGEVEHQVGGVAAATATSTDKAKVAFGNLKEDLGQKLIPIVDKLADTFVKLAPKIEPAIGKVGDAFGRVQAFLAPLIAQVVDFFQGEGGAAIKDFATQVVSAFQTNVLPVLKQGADTFQNVILPAVTSFVSYVVSALVPVFKQIAGIVVTQVLPILSSLALFLYGKVYPAIIKIVAAVATSLKPVFDQLVVTLQTQILPAVSKLLVAFKQAQPTIEKVALVVLKVVGFILKLAAAILAKVLPVVIRLIGYVYANMIPALIGFAQQVAKVISGLITFGRKVGEFAVGVKDKFNSIKSGAESLVSGVKSKFDSLVSFFKGLPGKIGGIFDGLWSGIAGGLKSALNSVLSLPLTIPRIDTHIPGVGTVGGQTLIPALAKGGIVSSPTLAMIGEAGPEMVLPLGRGGGLADTNRRLDRLIAAVEQVAPGVGGQINSAARAGYRKGLVTA